MYRSLSMVPLGPLLACLKDPHLTDDVSMTSSPLSRSQVGSLKRVLAPGNPLILRVITVCRFRIPEKHPPPTPTPDIGGQPLSGP